MLRADYLADVRRARRLFRSAGEDLPPEYVALRKRKLRVEQVEAEMRKALGRDRLTEEEKARVRLKVLDVDEAGVDRAAVLRTIKSIRGNPLDEGHSPRGPMHKLRLRLEDLLGFNYLERYTSYLNELKYAKKAS